MCNYRAGFVPAVSHQNNCRCHRTSGGSKTQSHSDKQPRLGEYLPLDRGRGTARQSCMVGTLTDPRALCGAAVEEVDFKFAKHTFR